jgi:hypothetical protein
MSAGSNSAASSGFIDRFSSRFKLRLDPDWSYRQKKLFILKKFLDGSIYDNLSPFHTEFTGNDNNGQYITLANRRPSVTYNLCKIIVEESISLLFGDDHFPVIRCNEYEKTSTFLQYITRTCGLKKVMLNAARVGSVGSSCIAIKVLEEKFYFEALETKNLTPIFNKMKPDELEEVIEKVKVDGSTLISFGYNISKDDLNKFYWVRRDWTKNEEIFYQPYLCEKDEDRDFSPNKDEEKSATHNFGFVSLVWIKNLPSAAMIDGACTFESILDINIEIDYQLSQLGRLIKYNSDPTFVIKNPSAMEGSKLIKSVGILNLDESGDAYYAEISGKSSEPAMNYVKMLREYALEVARGNRTNPDKINGVQSGKAIQMLNSSLISLVSEMRITYGDYGLLQIYKMVLDITNNAKIKVDYGDYPPDNNDKCEDNLVLDWPDWYPLSAQEKYQEAQTLASYKQNNILSTKTAVESIADEYNILDIPSELKDIEKEKKQEYTLSNSNSNIDNNSSK